MAFVKLKDWDLRNRPDLKVDGRRRNGPWGRSPRSATPWSSPSRRRPSSNWARPRASISSCWTAAAWATTALMAARNQLLGMAAQGPAADEGPAQRPGRRARVPGRRGLGKGRRPGAAHHLDPQHDLGGLRQRLRQRLHPGRPRQAGLRPGRRPLPHAAQGPGEALRPQHRGQDGPLLLLCLRPLDLRLSEAGALQRLSRP